MKTLITLLILWNGTELEASIFQLEIGKTYFMGCRANVGEFQSKDSNEITFQYLPYALERLKIKVVVEITYP